MLITSGNISLADARLLQNASPYPNPDWEPGSTEPWITQAVGALLLAGGATSVLELGGYKGACSVVLADALRKLGGGVLTVVEHDADLVPHIGAALLPFVPPVHWRIAHGDVLEVIPTLEDGSVEFAWVDDCHEAPHVCEELHRLIPKMRDDGLVLFHDVCGVYAIHHLVRHYGGISLNLPRVSNGGGLGILQVRPSTRKVPKMEMDWPEALLRLAAQNGNRRVFGGDEVPA